MSRKIKLSILILLLTAYMFISSFSNVKAQTENFTLIDDNGLLVTLETPWHVDSNSTFNITLTIKAAHADLENILLNLTKITTFIDENETLLLSRPEVFQIDYLELDQSESYQINITLPENSSKIVMGEIKCKWNIFKGETIFSQRTMFPIAVIADYWRQRAQDLQNKLNWYEEQYAQLNQTYHELEDKYNKKMGQLDATQRLSVIFGITTALFAFTTFYLFRRKPQIW